MRNGLMALLANNRGRGLFRAEAGKEEATVWLYDVIVSDDFWGGVSAITVGKELAALRDVPTIHLRINSPGGDVFAGRAMEQLIREHPSNIVAHIDGFAASAASYVALAADEVRIAEGGMYMIHKAWTLGWGNSEDLLKTAALLEQIDESLVKTYAQATEQDADQIREWMRDETWFSAEDAVKYGFADRLADASASNRAGWDLSAYERPPETAPEPEPPEPEPEPAMQIDRIAAMRRIEIAARI